MGKHIAEVTVKKLIQGNKAVKGARVLVLGLTFKEDVPDIRNTKVIDIVRELSEYGIEVLISDPVASANEARHEYGVELTALQDVGWVDAVILAVAHKEFRKISSTKLAALCKKGTSKGVFVDVKSLLQRAEVEKAGLMYWAL
jgi:UDP-N-acetyl-D-galactosamine dehydrogenase